MTAEIVLAFGKSFLFVFAALLPILNPAATAPIFLGLTEGASARTRAMLARKIARNMFALMLGSMLVGSHVLAFFGISLPIVRVGGGLILAATAWRLLAATQSTADSRTELAEGLVGLRSATGKQITMRVSVDPALLGGVVARVGSTVYDGSVRTQLKKMRDQLVAQG